MEVVDASMQATLDPPRNTVRQSARPGAPLDRVAAVSETTSDGSDARRIATEARDRVRFEEEALALADQVYRVARHLAGSREDADDLVQDTYARAFRSWRQYTPGTNLRAWLLRILTNLNIDKGRRQQRTPDTQPLEEGDYYLYNRLEQTMPDGQAGEERVLERLSQNDVVGALADVPHDFRDVIVLVDIGDFSYADAAQILDIPIGTVMSRLHRGRRILKQGMAEKVGER
jgi:RNA polymerase sigma-70 factor (ECF subfamily)